MCGIVAYAGRREASDVLIEGLRRLEYRGYDSAGIGVLNGASLRVRKRAGRIDNLSRLLAEEPAPGCTGIAHTRWATHGEPTDGNAHPHTDQSGKLALVHNGVIENYAALRDRLAKAGHTFRSQTDTEVLAHLAGAHYDRLPEGPDRLVEAVKAALLEVTGAYGIAVVHQDRPGEVVGARCGSPLVMGVGEGELFLASDVAPLVPYTRNVIYLNDQDIAHFQEGRYRVTSLTQDAIERTVSQVDWDLQAADKGDFPHFMLKEIFEQPASLENVLRGRLSLADASARLGGISLEPAELASVSRIMLIACGTALHAAKVGEYVLEELAGIPVETDFASEFRYRNSPLDPRTLVFFVSQSGETADTLAAMREVRRKGLRALGIVNAVGSSIARESDGGVYLHAGPEIGVAATKSFTSQVTAFILLALILGRARQLSVLEGQAVVEALVKMPSQVAGILRQSGAIQAIARKYARARSMLFLGRQANYPVAMEGALKLKEISYIHAEAYPSAELKHGVIALISPDLPTVAICPRDGVYDKNISSIQEVRARKGPVIAVASEGDNHIASVADDVIRVPATHPAVQPILNTVPLQLFAYHIAVELGCDVDKPRNLAKSVTVE